MVKEWYLLLKRYIEAESILIKLENYREEQREMIMSAHYPSYDNELEVYTSAHIEKTAIKLVSLDEYVEKTYNRCMKRIKLLEQALETLTYEEASAFKRVAWGAPSDVPERYEKQALKKVYEYVSDWTTKEEEKWLKEQRLSKAKALRKSLKMDEIGV